MDYQRKESESFMDWKLRLITGKIEKTLDLDWSEIVQILGLDCSADHLRKTAYGLYEASKYFEEKIKDGINDDNIFKELELKKQELEKEKIKVQTERITLNQALREEARFELFIEHAVKAIREVKPIQINTSINTDSIENINQSGLLIFADPHYAKEFKILGLYGEVINEYSIEIFEKRECGNFLIKRSK